MSTSQEKFMLGRKNHARSQLAHRQTKINETNGTLSGIPQIVPLPTPSACRLLPGIEINKEFTEFFNDPKRERLTSWALCSARSWSPPSQA
jgi:hypothetical protein